MVLEKPIKESMDYMWAPWRMRYILAADAEDGCIFCVKPKQDRDRDNSILWRGERSFVILNAYPYNPGHLMIVPYRHTGSVTLLDDGEIEDLMLTTKRVVAILKDSMNPDGFNIGLNEGRPAGAGIADHVHQHVVPRWSGDTNYMTSVGNTKVLPELVTETYDKLAPRFAALRDEL
jgi:ATP adenylyltransferase